MSMNVTVQIRTESGFLGELLIFIYIYILGNQTSQCLLSEFQLNILKVEFKNYIMVVLNTHTRYIGMDLRSESVRTTAVSISISSVLKIGLKRKGTMVST